MPAISPDQDYANRVWGRVANATAATITWVPPLIDPELDHQPSLRNKVLPLLISGLLEVGEEYENRIGNLVKDKRAETHPSARYYLSLLSFHAERAVDLLANFNRAQFIFLTEIRHQSVH